MSEQLLDWNYNGEDRWTASSVLNDEVVTFEWRIEVLEHGEFNVHGSDEELLDGNQGVYWSLKDAKLYCEGRERELRHLAKLDDSLQKALAEPLTFEWDEAEVSWWAPSSVKQSILKYLWIISVGSEGTFVVDQSSEELLCEDPPEFVTFSCAKSYCNQRERELLAGEAKLSAEDARERDLAMLESLRIREMEKRLEERTKLAEKLLSCVNREMYPCMVEQARKELQS